MHLLPGEVRDTVNPKRVEEILSGLKEKERRALELRLGFVDGSSPMRRWVRSMG